MTSHIMEYDVNTHLSNLKHDYPEAFGREGKLEDVVPEDNPDLKAIIEFRKACDQADQRKPTTSPVSAKKLIKGNRDYLIHEFKQGVAAETCANELGIATSTLKKYVRRDEKLNQIYRSTRKDYHRLNETEINQIYNLWKWGYPLERIVSMTGIARSTVYLKLKSFRAEEEQQ